MWDPLRLAAFTFLLANLFHSSLSLPVQKSLKCNGHPELCDRSYGNTTFLGSHDSFSISSNPWILARNQEIALKKQLELGVRMLQVQAHMNGDVLHFCHTSCLLFDGGSVEDYLKKVKEFLDQNPAEVITIVIANPSEIESKVFKAVFEKTGMADLAYVPPQLAMKRDDWPTLGAMINSGKRVVVFMDQVPTTTTTPTTSASPSPSPSPASTSSAAATATTTAPSNSAQDDDDTDSSDDDDDNTSGAAGNKEYIIPQFPVMWEDPYDPDDIDFQCQVDRTQGPLKPNQQLNLINHNLNLNFVPLGHGLRIPNRMWASVTNRASSIIDHAGHCSKFVDGKNPNFVLLDWVNIGQGARAVDILNGFN